MQIKLRNFLGGMEDLMGRIGARRSKGIMDPIALGAPIEVELYLPTGIFLRGEIMSTSIFEACREGLPAVFLLRRVKLMKYAEEDNSRWEEKREERNEFGRKIIFDTKTSLFVNKNQIVTWEEYKEE